MVIINNDAFSSFFFFFFVGRITTLGTLAAEFPPTIYEEGFPPREAFPRGPLFNVRWYRVIIDEAHLIKNHRTQGARAATALEAEFRWAVTGTPLQNSMMDLFSLLRFLHIRPYNNLRFFKEHLYTDGELDEKGVMKLRSHVRS